MERRTFLVSGLALAAAACTDTTTDNSTSPTSSEATTGSTASELSTSTSAATTTVRPRTTMAPHIANTGESPFGLGVASGDPDNSSVVIWTRLVTGADGAAVATGAVEVRCIVTRDAALADVVVDETISVDESTGHAVHFVANGLVAGETYYFWFQALGEVSPVGRTKTLPTNTDRARIVVASCQNYEDGFFNAWRHANNEDADLIVHLGDAVYLRDGIRSRRNHGESRPDDLTSLRRRWALYRADADLQLAHGSMPYVATWDDNEVASNYAALTRYQSGPTESFASLRAAAYQAWWEHQPTRLLAPVDGEIRIEREIRIGNLATIWLLDGRQYRSSQVCEPLDGLPAIEACDDINDPARTMLGAQQAEWLRSGIARSDAAWQVIAQATVVADWSISIAGITGINHDQWDGYRPARAELLEILAAADRTLMLSGDVHLAAVNTIDIAPAGETSVSEIVTPSISAALDDRVALGLELTVANLDHVHHLDTSSHGYVVLNISPDEARATFRNVDTSVAGGAASDGEGFIFDGRGRVVATGA